MSRTAPPLVGLAPFGLVLGAFLGAASAGAVERVAVLEFVTDPPGAISVSTLRLLSDEARRATVTQLDSDRYPVIGREAQQVIFDNFDVKAEEFCEAAANCEVKAAQMIRARYLFTGTITKIGTGLTLTIKLFDADKGKVLYIEKVDAKDEAGLYRGTFDAAKNLIEKGIKERTQGPVVEETTIGGGESRFSVEDVEETLVEFRSDPAGAVVRVDGMLLCTQTPCSRAVPKRSVRVAMEKENYLPTEERVTIRKGASVNLRLRPNFAMLKVQTVPSGLPVELNGRPVSVPSEGLQLRPGTYQVTVENSCYIQAGQEVRIDRGVDRTVRLEPNPHMAALRVRAILDERDEVVADVYVDGERLGSSMKTHKVEACARRLRVVAPDKLERLEYEAPLNLTANQKNTVTARFTSRALEEKRAQEAELARQRELEEQRRQEQLEAERREEEQRLARLEEQKLARERAALRLEEQREQQAQADAQAQIAADRAALLSKINFWSNVGAVGAGIAGGGALVLFSLTFASGPINIFTGILGDDIPRPPTIFSTGSDTLDTVVSAMSFGVGLGGLIFGFVWLFVSDFDQPPPLMGWCTEATADCAAPCAPSACL